MCLIVFSWQPTSQQPLRLAANRDEFYARPTAALDWWADVPQVLAGRDLQAGGTWLGVTRSGRFAALTNVRDLTQKQGSRSRGELTAGFLTGHSAPLAYCQQLAEQGGDFTGFNLLVGDHQQLVYFNPREGAPQVLAAGTYGLSNAALDTPWPKLLRTREGLLGLSAEASLEDYLDLLADPTRPADHHLPDTGIGLEWERLLGSAFIHSASYGTRASSVLRIGAEVDFFERSFGPHGEHLSDVQQRFVRESLI